jgi:hypothetical protein
MPCPAGGPRQRVGELRSPVESISALPRLDLGELGDDLEAAETRQLLAALKEQTVAPAHEPKEAEATASILKVIGEKILSFLYTTGKLRSGRTLSTNIETGVLASSAAIAASPDLSPTTASLAVSMTTPAMEIASAFEAIQERIRVLEIAFSRMPPPPAGLGHNNPPEP